MQPEQKQNVTVNGLEKLRRKNIFFGHQSVGFNIMDGVSEIVEQTPSLALNIRETKKPADFEKPVFAHARVGKNNDPSSKLADFQRIMDSGIGNSVDIAFFKFCYVDISDRTDVEKVFREYIDTMAKLKMKYPKVTFIHVTVPLKTVKKGFKTKLKEMMGIGTLWEYSGNIKRNEFNASLIREYQGKEPVFDLATIEATAPNGMTESFSSGGKSYLSLYPAYSNDGGHLNGTGRKKVADNLLEFLTKLHK